MISTTKTFLHSLTAIINYKTLIITAISIVCTIICEYYNFTADLPLTLLGTAIVFPVVFSISSAYKRREDALASYATLKGCCVSIYIAVRNWVPVESKSLSLLLFKMEKNVGTYFSHQEPLEKIKAENEFYVICHRITTVISSHRNEALSASEITRLDNYLNKIIVEYEKMKNIALYRTPGSLRAYAVFFIYTFPIFYAPYFAHFMIQGHPGLGIMISILYSFIFVSLANIQDHLENPFDQIGEDDMKFNYGEFEAIITQINAVPGHNPDDEPKIHSNMDAEFTFQIKNT